MIIVPEIFNMVLSYFKLYFKDTTKEVKMLVQVEGTCLFQEKPSGISVYGQNLIKELGCLCDPKVILPFSRINKYIKYRSQQPKIQVKLKNYKLDLFLI